MRSKPVSRQGIRFCRLPGSGSLPFSAPYGITEIRGYYLKLE
ncbi:hypothetical protein HMPREF3038_02624 [Akkermansia sp. KLE1797]|nr:hypothetical protein HMPREF3038_02624 [Akkermansia sp. KLE1797]